LPRVVREAKPAATLIEFVAGLAVTVILATDAITMVLADLTGAIWAGIGYERPNIAIP
jgi:hypothetical protein